MQDEPMKGELSEALKAMVKQGLEGTEFELVDLEYKGKGPGAILRVFVDKEGGVTVDDCARVSHMLSDLLDLEDLIPYRYTLEVSSPGERRTKS